MFSGWGIWNSLINHCWKYSLSVLGVFLHRCRIGNIWPSQEDGKYVPHVPQSNSITISIQNAQEKNWINGVSILSHRWKYSLGTSIDLPRLYLEGKEKNRQKSFMLSSMFKEQIWSIINSAILYWSWHYFSHSQYLACDSKFSVCVSPCVCYCFCVYASVSLFQLFLYLSC